jgi:uncharacterized surface protein with fasciclin (FAS1) repeats
MIFSFGCKKDLQDIYSRPSWLAGKVFTQIEAQPELSTFARCIKRTGYDTLINKSGSYTIFAPDDNAFSLYFQSHPQYKTIEDVPIDELRRIVEYHMIKDPWSEAQLRQLDIGGWIDTTAETNNKPRGFKRETFLKNKDTRYGVLKDEFGFYKLVDTLKSPWHRKVATDAAKYASIFYKEYFDIYKYQSTDYQFYFNRAFENPTDMYYMGGRVIKSNIFAENGFIHIIDKVNEPLQNAYEILNSKKETYSEFLDLINSFPSFAYNQDKTNAQPGATLGVAVDSLFDISYPTLTFDILNEQTKAPSGTTGLTSIGNVTIRYQNGLVAPTNEAFADFVNEYFIGSGKWGSIKNSPSFIRRIVANTYMSTSPIYPSFFQSGYISGEKDFIKMDKSAIVEQQYGSNCTFIGVNKALIPRAFKSVTGPIYLNRGYSTAMYAIEEAQLLTALKKENNDYSLYVESDENCRIDSSLIAGVLITGGREMSSFSAYQKVGNKYTGYPLSDNDLRTLLMNHIGIETPRGIARKEFIKNMAGNFLIINNQTGEVSGTAPTKFGYNGTTEVHVVPNLMSNNTDNGKTYDIKNWFSFAPTSLYVVLSNPGGPYYKFHNLIKKAGLADDAYSKYTFLSDNEFYTVFAPNNAAIDAYRTDTLTSDQLKKFVRMHFVQGNLIFTDGKKNSDYYETARIDERSTPYTTVFTKIYIKPDIDVINIMDKSGNNYVTINESAVANMIMGYQVSTNSPPFPVIVSNAVVHEIDKVLLIKDLDTN